MTERHDILPLVPADIDTYRQPVVYMREDCHVCRSEGFGTQSRIEIEVEGKRIIATLNVITGGDWLPQETAALSNRPPLAALRLRRTGGAARAAPTSDSR